MEKTVSRALVVLAVVLALGVGFYAGREVWPADGPFQLLTPGGKILLNTRTGETWLYQTTPDPLSGGHWRPLSWGDSAIEALLNETQGKLKPGR